MSAQALFGLTFLPAGLAVLVAMAADAGGARRAARIGVPSLFIAAGVAAIVGGWSMDLAVVGRSFSAGGYSSTVAGACLVLTGLALLGVGRDAPMSSYSLGALAGTGAALAVTATDLMALVICLESSAMSGYALVAIGGMPASREAAVKYFVQGAVATGLFVLGLASLLPVAAGLTFSEIARAGSSTALAAPVVFGVMAVAAALSFKVGAAPFHSWAPDAYQQASPSGAALLSGAVKLATVLALSLFVAAARSAGASASRPFGFVGADLMAVLGVFAALSVILGSTVALGTRSYTRMLGYAGVAQAGYALIALAAMGPAAAVAFGLTYAIASTGAFLAADAFRRVRPEWDGTIAGLGGIGSEAPVTSAALTLILMSLAGIPPLFGFWGKFQAFGTAVGAAVGLARAGMGVAGLLVGALAALGVIGSVVSLGYYGSVVRGLYFGSPPTEGGHAFRGWHGAAFAVVVTALLLLAAGVIPLFAGITSSLSGFLPG